MINKFNYLFQYLDKENINIDKEEFLFQNQSHPDYPSALAIADTLSFFNIQNGVIRVDFEDLELLPERFVAELMVENNKPTLETTFVLFEKKGTDYYYTAEKKAAPITQSELEKRWRGIVLLAEKSETTEKSETKKKKLTWLLPLFATILFLVFVFRTQNSWFESMFFIFPVLGILFSVAALKDLFGTKSEMLNNFCNLTTTTSCSSVIDSKKWNLFSYIDLSSLSIIFYTSQLVAFFSFVLNNATVPFFSIQKILLFCAIPVIVMSVYYQKQIEKKWCPVCLAISTILMAELGYLHLFVATNFNFTLSSILLLGFIFTLVAFVWVQLKNTLLKHKELKEFQLKGNRFMRNYTIFKNSLVSKASVSLPDTPIILGNKDSKTEISIISSPFCGHCEKAHHLLEEIITTNSNDLKVKVYFNADFESIDEERKRFLRRLMTIYLEDGSQSFVIALDTWFKTKDLQSWFQLYGKDSDAIKLDPIFNLKNEWCKANAYTFTPNIFVNGFEFPKSYDRESLPYFVNELIEDEGFVFN
jgi:uncharacterized membrane protein